MKNANVSLLAVLVGRPAPFGPPGVKSAIAKERIERPVMIGPEGLIGDEQGDKVHHGGPEKAVHHYAFEHYAAWHSEFAHPLLDAPGAFGENLSTIGLTEREICVGDIWRVGTAVLEVSQARQPCWKLNHRFGVADMARRVQTTGRTGWYYRVLEPGQIAPGSPLQLVERPTPDWPLSRLLHHLYVECMDLAALKEIAELSALSESWRQIARRRLERRVVESWDRRIDGAASTASSGRSNRKG